MQTILTLWRRWALVLLVALWPFTGNAADSTFVNVTETLGLPPDGYGPVSWGDFDNDGRLDLLVGGTLWRNTGSGFTNVTASIAPGLAGISVSSAAWADYDGDGRLDFLITGPSVSQIWRNTGSNFVNVTATVAPGLPGLWGSSVAWGDYDNDGRPDFLIAGYSTSQIWRNTGSNFVNVTATVAPGLRGFASGSVAWGDYDNDGRLDFIITGGIPRRSDLDDDIPLTPISQLWRNTGSGFVDVTSTVGWALPGVFWSSAAWGDYDNDGRLDLLLTGSTRSSSFSQLWRNTGSGFVDVTASVTPGLPGIIQGPAAWGDYDNDGRLDILLSGYLFRNTGNGFIKATATDAPGLSQVVSSSLAWGDYDNDGRLDFILSGSAYFDCDGCDYPPPVFQLWQNNIVQTNPPPAIITKTPANVSQTSAVLNASINPRGSSATAWFVWGDTTNYGHVTAAQATGNGSSFADFSQAITGLSTGVTYYCRAVGSNDQGQVFLGFEQHLLVPPSVTTGGAESVGPNSATFHAQASPNNLPTYGWFEWGLTPAYGQRTPVQFLGGVLTSGFGENIFGLQGTTTYYFRAVASNSLGVAYGAAGSLITPIMDVCPGYISPTSKSLSYRGGGAYSVFVFLQCGWIVINTNSWISIISPTNASGGNSLIFTLGTNDDLQPRSGNITVGGHNFLVTQAGFAGPTTPPGTNVSCIYSMYSAGVTHGYGATTNTIYFDAATNCAWSASISNSWITILSGASGMGSSQVVYAITANTGMQSRSGNITIGDRNFAITQEGHSDVSLPADQVIALGGIATFSVTINLTPPFTCQWQFNGVDLVDGGGVSGAATSNLVLTGVQYSQGGHYRVVVSNVFGLFISSSATLTVAPTSDALSLAEALDTGDQLFWKTWSNSRGIWFGQTNTTHDGIDALECSAIAPGEFASLEAKSGGPGILSFWWKTAFATPSVSLLFWIGSPQSTTLTNSTDWEQRTFMVPGDVDLRWTFMNSSTGDQSKAWLDQVQFTPCNFTLSPSYGDSVSSLGATGRVTLTAAGYCPWLVVNTNSWITILSNVISSGNGSVIYAVAANPSTASRNGYIVIADLSFYIYQNAGAPANNPAISLPEALDTEGSLAWSTIGTPEWFGQTIVSRDGADAAQSGPIGASGAVTATTSVEGPGTVLFWWKVSSETNKDYLKFFINGVQQTRISGEVDWQLLSYDLISVTNTLKWTYSKNGSVAGGNDRGWLDQVQFIPAAPTGCVAAISPISATHSGNSETGLVYVVAAAGCGWDVVNTNSWITYLASPGDSNGLVRYTVGTNNSRNQRTGVLLIGGRPFTVTQNGEIPPCLYSISPMSVSHGSPAGSRTVFVTTQSDCQWNVFNTNDWITITASPNNFGSGQFTYFLSQNTSFIARTGQVSIGNQILTVMQSAAPLPAISLAEALDTVGTPLVWDKWGGSWFGQGNVTHDGVDAAESGETPDNVGSGIYAEVNGPATLSFWWKVSSETNYDTLRLYVNYVEVARISGEVDWQQRSLTLPAGTQTILWYYSKDTSLSMGQDHAWVDQVQFVPISGCPASLSATNAFLPSSSSTGTLSVAIPSGCPWGVFNPNSWVSILSGANGTGNGSVTYIVEANPTHYDRSGNIQIADQVFVVTQAGIYTAPSNCFYTVSPNGFGGGYTPFNGTVFVEAQSSCQWNVLNTNAWITITSSLTNSGIGQVTFSVSQNTSSDGRSGNISVAGQLVTISQSGAPNTPISLPQALDTGGTLVWTTGGGAPWSGQTVVTHDGVDAAKSGAIGDSGTTSLQTTVNGPGTLSFWWKASSETNHDTLRLYLNGVEQARISGEVDWEQRTVTLPAGIQRIQWNYSKDTSLAIGQDRAWLDQVQFIPTPPCPVTLSPGSASYPASSSTGMISVAAASNCTWYVFNTNIWISTVSGTNGTGSGSVTYIVAANASASVRSGNLRIADQVFLVTQSGNTNPPPGCTYSISTPSRGESYGAATNSVAVTAGAGCAWLVLNTNSWINFTSATNGTGNGTVVYSISANPSTNARSGNVQIAGLNYALTQSGAPWVEGCPIVLSPVARTHDSASSTGVVTITTPAGCEWQVLNTNSWVTLVGATNGTGVGEVLYSLAANPNSSSRGGTLFVGGHFFFIIQTGAVASCTISISPGSRTHGYNSATGTVAVTTQNGCAWTVVNTNPWVSIVSSRTNLGSGPMLYSIAPNTNAQARAGIVRLGGQQFLLTQSGTSLSGTNAPWLQFMSRTETGATLAVQGAGGKMYVVECSEDSIHWIPISTNSAPSIVTDAVVGNAPQRFYRSVEIP